MDRHRLAEPKTANAVTLPLTPASYALWDRANKSRIN
jgi:hypothetical protein